MTSITETKFLRFESVNNKEFLVFNRKSGVELGIIGFDNEWKKFVFEPVVGTKLKFDADCQKDISIFLTKCNQRKIFTDKKPGRPKGSSGIKHGFYVNKMRPCMSCSKFQDESCPYYYVVPQSESMQEHMFDEFGVNRCVPEYKYFQLLKKEFTSAYTITKAEEPLLDKMCMILIRTGRVEEYLADEGLVQIRNVKDEKSGRVLEVPAQNLLKKDAYFDDKVVREWLGNLKISRKERDVESGKDDLAIIFTEEKSVKIQGNKAEVKQMISDNKEKIQEHLDSTIEVNKESAK